MLTVAGKDRPTVLLTEGYALGSAEDYKGKDKLPPYRAYISVNKVAYACELTFTIGDDYSTDIRSVQRKAAEDDAYYNLNGQRTEHPDKGIYIYKGKKVIK